MAAASSFAQERPRYFDNFDTPKGVTVTSNLKEPTVVGKPSSANSTVRTTSRPYLPSPGVSIRPAPVDPENASYNNTLIRRTAQVSMTVYDGYAEAEIRRSPAEARLIMAAGKHLGGYSTGDPLVDAYIVDSSRRYGIDPLLIYAQMGQESSFKKTALSHKGASGLMQLMPATARRLGVTNIYDPKQNIEGGVKYMRILLDMFGGDLSLALAGYNAGEGAVMKYGNTIPPYNETQDYVRRISARYSSISRVSTARNVR
jgi:soluble lytic murein transglycosylase-like protein